MLINIGLSYDIKHQVMMSIMTIIMTIEMMDVFKYDIVRCNKPVMTLEEMTTN